MFDKFRELDESLKKKFGKYSMQNKFPGYFNRNVFRGAALCMLLLLIGVFVQQGFDFGAGISVSCSESSTQPCQNPVYDCGLADTAEELQLAPFCNIFGTLDAERPDAWVCSIAPCDKPYLQPGESYTNAGWLLRHGIALLSLIIFLAFLVNAMFYYIKTGSFFYVR